MSHAHDSFLKHGVSEYAEANATLQAFRTWIEDRLRTILRARKDWTTFVPSGNDSIASWHSWGSTSAHVTAWIEGKVQDNLQANLAIGIWWNPGWCKDDVIFHANYEDADPKITTLQCRESNDPISAALGDGVTRLFLRPGTDPDFDHDFNLLIDALQAQLG